MPRVVSRVGLTVIAVFLALPAIGFADVLQPALRIRELNVTGEEFVVIQNVGAAPAQLNEFWLGYSSDDTASYVVPSQQLPASNLEPGQVLLLNNGSTATCDANLVDQLGFASFSNTKGIIQLRHLANDGPNSTFSTVDSVAWGKLPADGIQIAHESELSDAATPVWYRDVNDAASSWRVGDMQGCSLTLLPELSDDPSTPPTTVVWSQNSLSPPSVYVGAGNTRGSNEPFIPASDKGLKAPQLSEILPNAASPQTDAADEFIELYNPNNKPFDLSGFMLQIVSTSSTTTHTYHFPAGITLDAGGFKAFRSAQTHLALSNSGGQVWFVDPLGTTLDTSDPYGSAKDGQSWVDASGKWQWTLQATPGLINKIATPLASSSSSKTATVNGKKITGVAGSSTNGSAKTLGASTTAAAAQPLSIHPLTLAIIIAAALLYGAYEYRHDLALKYRQFRRNRGAGR